MFDRFLPENRYRRALSLFVFGYTWFVVSTPYAFVIAAVSSYQEHTSGGDSGEFSIYISSLFLIFLLITYSQIWYLGAESNILGKYPEKLGGLYIFGLVFVGYIVLTMVIIRQPYDVGRALVLLFLFVVPVGLVYILYLSSVTTQKLEDGKQRAIIRDILSFLALGVVTSVFLFPMIPLVLLVLGAVYLFGRLFPKDEE